MNHKPSIAFIIPWFGPWPKWMRFTLQSMGYNPDIDFLFFTDQNAPDNCPDNVKMTQLSWDNYKKKVSDKLQIKFTPENAYKLCDLKPAFGDVHQTELMNYDFWGFCDIDLIFGQVRNYLDMQNFFAKYEAFTSYHRRLMGHFTLMKNNKHWRQVYQQCTDWKTTLEDSEKNYAFDEKSFSDLFIRFKNWPESLRPILHKLFKPLSRKMLCHKECYHSINQVIISSQGSKKSPSQWYWINGNLLNNASENQCLYFHFLTWKKQWRTLDRIDFITSKKLPLKWLVDNKGFFDYE